MGAIPLRTLIIPGVTHIALTYGAAGGAPPAAEMAAIGLQESGFEARDQLEVQNGRLVSGAIGPACGFWQFERGGGVRGVMRHAASRKAAQELTLAAGVPFDEEAIWRHFATIEGDELAAAFARLLLLTDPQPLPPAVPASEQAAFDYYLRNWRPGSWFNSPPESPKRAELRAKWGRNWTAAIAAVAEVADASPPNEGTSGVAPATPPDPGLTARVAALERKLELAAYALG